MHRVRAKGLHLTKKFIRALISNFSSGKYLSGNGFMKFCDVYIQKATDLSTKEIANAKTIFVKSDLLMPFFEKYQNQLMSKVVVSGNGDTNFDEYHPFFSIPSSVYLQNLGFEPPVKTVQLLPIGLENYEHVRSGFGVLHFPPITHKKKYKILVPPMSPTNSIRKQVIHDLEITDRNLFEVETKLRSILSYLRLTKSYKFVLVCEGNGHDTHRLWEVLYQNSFPVMLNTPFSRNIRNLGLPVLITDSILDVSKSTLIKHLNEHQNYKRKSQEILWLPYWKNEILGPRVKTH